MVVETAHTSRQAAEKHKEAGARWVIVTSPMEDPDFTAVIGVNNDGLDAERHRIVSTASHITASVGPVAAVLDKAAGVNSAVSTTLHAYSASSGIAELPSDDLRRTRGDGANVVPTSTAASREIAQAFPHLNGSFSATSVRLPVADGSLTELVVVLRDAVPAQALNEAFGDAARGMLKGTLSYTEDPIVSRDVLGNASSAVVDGALTRAFGAHARVFAWSDSEWSYASRIADTVDLLQY